jgi:hypothetical protein
MTPCRRKAAGGHKISTPNTLLLDDQDIFSKFRLGRFDLFPAIVKSRIRDGGLASREVDQPFV